MDSVDAIAAMLPPKREEPPPDLKTRINALLWEGGLPPDVTMGQADDIACEIYWKLKAEWDRYAHGSTNQTEPKDG